MQINILTLFPDFFETPFKISMIHKAQKIKAVYFKFYNLRDFGIGPRKQVDDRPYGGGAGMVLRVDVMDEAIKKIRKDDPKTKIILLTPKGKTFDQNLAQSLSGEESLTLICGHYEGFDERIRDLVDAEISIGNFVLTGGEPAALMIIDAITRLIPCVLDDESAKEESFSFCHSEVMPRNLLSDSRQTRTDIRRRLPCSLKTKDSLAMTKGNYKKESNNHKLVSGNPLLEYPHYTRPEKFKNQVVPQVLLSGNHAEVKKWRLKMAQEETKKRHFKSEAQNPKS